MLKKRERTGTSPETMEENMKKKLLSIVLAICLLFSLVPAPAMATEKTGAAVHKHDGITFKAVSDEAGLMEAVEKSGSYYLTDNITLKGRLNIYSGTVNLCLNGYDLKPTADSLCAIKIEGGATLNLYDCDTTRVRYGQWDADQNYTVSPDRPAEGKEGVDYDVLTGGIITGGHAERGAVYNAGKFSMYGGNITGHTGMSGGGVYNKGTFSMYGGNITGNTATESGGGVCNGDKCVFSMYGGSITGNTGAYGGGVHNDSSDDSSGTFNMSGG